MDPLAAFLDGPRARGAFVLRALLDPPWSLRVQDGAPLTVVALLAGDAWFVPDGAAPGGAVELGAGDVAVPLGAGDVAVVRGPEPYVVADHPTTAPNVVIHPGERCTTPDGDGLAEAMDLGVRTWGNSPCGHTVMIVGTYQTDGQVSRWLLDALPQLVHLRAGTWECPVLPLLAAEVVKDEPGQQVVLDRLLDLLLVAALRAAFAADGSRVAPPWFRGHADPVVGRVLRLMQNAPAEPWTVGRLASAAGVSRALLARRFHELVGEPPKAFLTGWRMALAADLVAEPGATVTQVAHRVGYASPFTFSTAFKRHHGTSPRAFRDRLAERSAHLLADRSQLGGTTR